MRELVRIFSLMIACLFLSASLGAAQQRENQAQQQTGQSQAQQQQQQAAVAGQQDLVTSNWLVGQEIFDARNEEIGNVDNLIIQGGTGKIGYVVVGSGGFLNMGDERHVIPFEALKITEEGVNLNMDQNKLSQAPAFREGMSMEEFDRQSAEFFGVSPAWEESGAMEDGKVFQEDEAVFEEDGVRRE